MKKNAKERKAAAAVWFYKTLVVGLATMAIIPAANAQQRDNRLQGYYAGQGHMYHPYQAKGRDRQGNRIIINGRIVSSEGNATEPKSRAATFSGGVSTHRRNTLRRSTLTNQSIGNNVQITNSWGGTYIINQRNNGRQTATINGGQ